MIHLRPRRGLVAVGIVSVLVLASCAPASEPGEGPAGGGASPEAGGSPSEEGPRPDPLVDPSEIVSGGPPPDGIPPIDDPSFLAAEEVRFLEPQEPVIAVEIDGDARAYPARILVWHEIVNDVVGEVPITVTYCPLCNTGIVFLRPTIDGELLDFGTSGKLYRSNLVMYDRQTNSFWPQALGQAVLGPLTGTELELAPAQLVAFGDWVEAHPDGLVLDQRTGHDRPYGENPYVGYDDPRSPPSLFYGDRDDRLPPKTRVVGIRIGEREIAYPYPEIQAEPGEAWATTADRFADERLVIFWKAGTVSAIDAEVIAESHDVGSTGVFRPTAAGRELSFVATAAGPVDQETGSRWDIFGRAVAGPLSGAELERVVAIESFWFDWAAIFPGTAIFGIDG